MSSVSSLALYKQLIKSAPEQYAKFASSAQVTKGIEDFKSRLSRVETVDDFLNDRKLMDFAMQAFGLGGDATDLGFARRALKEDPAAEDSTVAKTGDSRLKALAEAFDFAKSGVAKLQSGEFVSELATRYTGAKYDAKLREQSPALQQALAFRQQSGSMQTALDVLGSGSARNVVTAVLNVPVQIVNQSVARQVDYINARLDVSQFTVENKGPTRAQVLNEKLATTGAYIAASNQAQATVDTIGDKLKSLIDSYDNLSKVLAIVPPEKRGDPAVVDDLIGLQGQLGAAASALNEQSGTINTLNSLLTLAGREIAAKDKDGKDIPVTAQRVAQIKADFAAAISQLTTRMGEAGYGTYNGQTVLNNPPSGTLDTVTLTLDPQGTKVSVTDVNQPDILTALNAANAVIQGATDEASLQAALRGTEAQLITAKRALDPVREKVLQQQGQVQSKVAGVPSWETNLDLGGIATGREAVDRAGTALTTITSMVAELKSLARQAADPAASAETKARLQAAYGERIATMQKAVADAGAGGGDNLLSGTGTFTYRIKEDATNGDITTSLVGRDLAATLQQLAGKDLTNAADAQSLVDLVNGAVGTALSATRSDISRIGSVLSGAENLDSRGKVQSQIKLYVSGLKAMIEAAGSGGINVLDPAATDAKVDLADGPGSATLRAHSDLLSSLKATLDGASAEIGAGWSGLTNTNLRGRLTTAWLKVSDISGALATNRGELEAEQTRLQKDISAEQTAPGTLNEVTPFADKFIQRYLALADAGGGNTSVNGSLASSALVALSLLS
ncbi:DUF1217 domain-containing protein [Zavarzinia sp. CC-PAN008]|uniref:DUF1217 domain-containing protein n=1 Tax=Zavarzinia sp. CC-PAN008 TaxID=3243332 RepID=UPI003F747A42